MDARRWHRGRRDIDAVLDELEVRFLLDPDTAFETTGTSGTSGTSGTTEAGHDGPGGGGAAATNPGRPAQPDPPKRR